MAEGIIESILMAVICSCATVGNISLFIVVFTTKSLQTVSNYYVLSLATADLLITVVSGPVTAFSMVQRKWVLGGAACTTFGFITLLSFVSSVCNLAMIALNRFFYIVRWKTYKTNFKKAKAFKYGLCVWLISFLLSIPPLLGWSEIQFIEEKSYCFVKWQSDVFYMFFMVGICFFGPLLIMIISYYKIITFTRSLKKKLLIPSINLPDKSHQQKEKKLVSNEEIKLTNTLLLVVACFVICWAPFAITMFFDVYFPHPLPRPIHITSLCLGYLNSMCNPILYGVRSSSFRKGYFNLYYKCCSCLFNKDSLRNSSGNTNSAQVGCSTVSQKSDYREEQNEKEEALVHAFCSKVAPKGSRSIDKYSVSLNLNQCKGITKLTLTEQH